MYIVQCWSMQPPNLILPVIWHRSKSVLHMGLTTFTNVFHMMYCPNIPSVCGW